MNAIIVLLVIICLIGGVIWLLRSNKSPRQRRRAQRAAGDNDTQARTPSKPGGLEKRRVLNGLQVFVLVCLFKIRK